MKKTYSKPHIYFDSFELSQHIATCGTEVDGPINMGDGDDPTILFGGLITSGCNVDYNGTDKYDICYHVFEAGNAFGS